MMKVMATSIRYFVLCNFSLFLTTPKPGILLTISVPNITVTPVVINAFYNRLNGINLIRAHHHQFLLTLHQNHIAIYHFSKFNTQHFDFDADEKFLPIYTYADKQNQKITNLVEFSEVFLSKCKLAEMKVCILIKTLR
jgi:hypothetical protein